MRAVIVVKQGWIFAGDITEENGRIKLSRVTWVFQWEKIGFNGVIKTPEKVDLRPMADMEIQTNAELFRVPVEDDWGVIDG